MAVVHTLGFPRIGAKRELKRALESYWKGETGEAELEDAARELRSRHWQIQRDAGLDYVAVGDFSYYDQMLDMSAMLGAVPSRFGFSGDAVDLRTYFAMARGSAAAPAMEMTKWFDTNYHYIVPEFEKGTRFALRGTRIVDEAREALHEGFTPKPVLVGPLTYLWLGKERGAHAHGSDRLDLVAQLLPVYQEVLRQLKAVGVGWVQLDEPALAAGLPKAWLAAFPQTYQTLAQCGVDILLATYFESVQEHAAMLQALPVSGIHLDLVRAPEQLDAFVAGLAAGKVLSCGVVDGRNVWRTDLRRALGLLDRVRAKTDNVWVAPSCSLIHAPVDLALETKLDVELRSWLAFSAKNSTSSRCSAAGWNMMVARRSSTSCSSPTPCGAAASNQNASTIRRSRGESVGLSRLTPREQAPFR